MISKTITQECNIYKIKEGLIVKIWNDKTFSIILTEDMIDLTPSEVKDLHRITSAYKATYEEWEE